MASTNDGEAELERLKVQVIELRREFYAHMGPWQRAQIARHPQRPYTMDWINLLITEFVELHGDRGYGDDKAMIAGMGKFRGRAVAVVGHQKGRDTKQRVIRNFGQPKPEGYRKALRVMKLAAKYNRPVLTFIDTPGAYPGIDAEERGQGEAIARNLLRNGAPPGAHHRHSHRRRRLRRRAGHCNRRPRQYLRKWLLLSDFSRRLRLHHLARFHQGGDRGTAMKITANDLKELGIIDEIIPEPDGGAHADHEGAAKLFGEVLERQLLALSNQSAKELVDSRYQKFRHMCQFFDIHK